MESLIREIEAETLPENLLVEFNGDVNEVECGIGAYEYFGERGFDTTTGVKCEDVWYDEKSYTETENAIIKQYLDNNFDSITRELEEQY